MSKGKKLFKKLTGNSSESKEEIIKPAETKTAQVASEEAKAPEEPKCKRYASRVKK